MNTIEINFVVGERSYVKKGYPTVGELIDLETEKSRLSRGELGSLYDSGLIVSINTAKLIGAIAFFNVFFPELNRDLKTQDISKLQLPDMIELYNIYIDKIIPYMENVYKLLNNASNQETSQN